MQIRRDAHADEIVVTASDQNRNINVQCSSGFYAQVAKPTLCALANEPLPKTMGLTISCDNVTRNLDSCGSEYNLTLFFKVPI